MQHWTLVLSLYNHTIITANEAAIHSFEKIICYLNQWPVFLSTRFIVFAAKLRGYTATSAIISHLRQQAHRLCPTLRTATRLYDSEHK